MPKGKKAVAVPSSAREVTKEYIGNYFADGLKKKTITKEQFDEWIETVSKIEKEHAEEKMKVFGEVRKVFIEKYLPQLSKKNVTSLANYFKQKAE